MKYKFHTKKLEEMYYGGKTYNIHEDVLKLYRLRVYFIRNAVSISDLKSRSSFNLEKLNAGKFKNLWSIRLNRQWRLIFDLTNDWFVQVVDIIDLSKHYE